MTDKNKKVSKASADLACNKSHEPNASTAKTLLESKDDKNVTKFDNPQDMFAFLKK